MPKSTTISLKIPNETMKILDDLQVKSGVTLEQTFARAFALYEMTLDYIAAGGQLIFRDKDGNDEPLEMP